MIFVYSTHFIITTGHLMDVTFWSDTLDHVCEVRQWAGLDADKDIRDNSYTDTWSK